MDFDLTPFNFNLSTPFQLPLSHDVGLNDLFWLDIFFQSNEFPLYPQTQNTIVNNELPPPPSFTFSTAQMAEKKKIMQDPKKARAGKSTLIKKRQQETNHFLCHHEGCGKVFNRKYNLSSHWITHSAQRNYVCSVCPKAFVRRHDLKRHSRIHTGETPHKCCYCQRGYGRADALQRHYYVNNECALQLRYDPTNPLYSKRKSHSLAPNP